MAAPKVLPPDSIGRACSTPAGVRERPAILFIDYLLHHLRGADAIELLPVAALPAQPPATLIDASGVLVPQAVHQLVVRLDTHFRGSVLSHRGYSDSAMRRAMRS